MTNNNNQPLPASPPSLSRRRFVQGSSALVLGSSLPSMSVLALGNSTSGATGQAPRRLANNPLGFNGERQDPATGLYHLGQGYRVYNPALMRFHAADSMSPFGQGGVNAYAYCLGNPINLRDPSGHFAIMSMLIGIFIGATIGAVTSAISEGIRAGVTHTQFDWKQVVIGAALGGISGGFGAAGAGAKFGVKVGLAVADALVSGGVDFGLNVATGSDNKQAAINAGIGAVIGLLSFGVGQGTSRGLRGNSITLGGGIRDFNMKDTGIGVFTDTYKGTKRLNILSHGKYVQSPLVGKSAPVGSYLIKSNGGADHGKLMSAQNFIDFSKVNFNEYEHLRVVACHSAEGGESSFASNMHKITGKPVKGFLGAVNLKYHDNIDYLIYNFNKTHSYNELGGFVNGIISSTGRDPFKIIKDQSYRPVKFGY